MALFKFTKNILNGKPIDVFNNGKHVRDFTYVDDIVNGIYGAIRRDFSGSSEWNSVNPSPENSSAPYEIYNLGNSKPVKLMDYINEIEKNLGIKAKLIFYHSKKEMLLKLNQILR